MPRLAEILMPWAHPFGVCLWPAFVPRSLFGVVPMNILHQIPHAIAALSIACSANGASSTTDVLVVVLDDVASVDLDAVRAAGRTPNLDALAARGVTFTRCYANSTCSPTRRSILTGHWWVGPDDDVCAGKTPTTPLASEEFLPAALPHASAVIGKWHLGAAPNPAWPWELAPIARGFSYWMAGQAGNVLSCGGTGYSDWLRVNSGWGFYQSQPVTAYEPYAVRDAFTAAWPQAASPKFAYVCPQLAHAPFHRPANLPASYPPTPGARAKYESMIASFDIILGQMLAKVDLDTTLVIVVGDNGTPEGVAPGQGRAKTSTYERGVRVPLIIGGAGVVTPGRTNGELVHVVDLWSTVIEAGGGARVGGSPYPIASTSLAPILADAPHLPPHDYVLVGCRWGEADGDIASVSAAGTKLRLVDLGGDKAADMEYFFDLTTDPGELSNLVNDPARAAEIAAHRAFLQQAIP